MQGFGVSSLSAILATWQYKDYFNHPESVTQGGIMASLAGGCLLGALFSSWVGDRLGRRDSMAVACCIFIVGSTLMCAVQKQAMLIIARMVNGFAVGLMTSQGYGPFVSVPIKSSTNTFLYQQSHLYCRNESSTQKRPSHLSATMDDYLGCTSSIAPRLAQSTLTGHRSSSCTMYHTAPLTSAQPLPSAYHGVYK